MLMFISLCTVDSPGSANPRQGTETRDNVAVGDGVAVVRGRLIPVRGLKHDIGLQGAAEQPIVRGRLIPVRGLKRSLTLHLL